MSTLPEKGVLLTELEDELILIKNRIEKEGLRKEDIRVVIKTTGQLRPFDTYGFAIEETEDEDGKLTGIQLLVEH